jgi:predicted phosphodiesterase
MRVAVLSDIHSNAFALQAVLRDVRRADIDEVWVAGDTFGYYPWAAETFELIAEASPLSVLGNHDRWVLDDASAPADITAEIARQNRRDLPGAALEWLAPLQPVRELERGGLRITIAHGTPDDPLEGRYYPDDNGAPSWLPAAGEVLILGQTHYPLLRGDSSSGLLLNPGSVGQPRDGTPMPSWAALDLATGTAELRRAAYDHVAVMERLQMLGWDQRVTAALDKRPLA